MTYIRELTGKQARYLRGLAHSLKPLLQLGKGGLTDAFLAQVDQALERHELIKVKLIPAAPMTAKEAGEAMAQGTKSHLAQVIGKTCLLYRARKDKPTIQLPKE